MQIRESLFNPFVSGIEQTNRQQRVNPVRQILPSTEDTVSFSAEGIALSKQMAMDNEAINGVQAKESGTASNGVAKQAGKDKASNDDPENFQEIFREFLRAADGRSVRSSADATDKEKMEELEREKKMLESMSENSNKQSTSAASSSAKPDSTSAEGTDDSAESPEDIFRSYLPGGTRSYTSMQNESSNEETIEKIEKKIKALQGQLVALQTTEGTADAVKEPKAIAINEKIKTLETMKNELKNKVAA